MLSEQEIQRRQKREELIQMGINPYPAEMFESNVTAEDINKNYENNKIDYKNVSIAGRLMSFRIMGSASFVELQDATGRVQLYFRRDDLCPDEDKTLYNTVFKKLLDIGDIIGVKGYVFTTQTGEISIHVTEFKLLNKSLRPLPVVKRDEEGHIFDGLTDPEMRYRQRYVDLIVNPEVKEIFVKRARIISTMRQIFDSRGWLEVETPILQPIHGGAAARPFTTHHNTLDMPLYLRIANELYLKRLIVGGFEGVYEFGKMFRNEGMDRTHNPEFTSLEFYIAYKDYFWMMEMTEEIFEKVAIATNGKAQIKVGENEIDFTGPFERLTIAKAIEKYTNINVEVLTENEIRKFCQIQGIKVDDSMAKGKLIDEIFGEKVEANLIQPTFIIDYPVEMSPLTKKHRTKEGLVERFELFVNGKEIANAYTELNDPIDQRERFEEQLKLAARGDDEAMAMDEDFIRSLEYGMPPTSGIGIGIDRLTMLMTNQTTIQEVLFFPQMRPEKKAEVVNDEEYEAIGVPKVWIPVLQKM
jgi:lysyl-tRNA synthetase class 2